MKKILAIQNVSCEPLGSIAEEGAERAEFHYVKPYRGEALPGDLKDWDGLVVLGGPMAVYEADAHPHLRDELALLRQAIDLDLPTLGVCLGSQLIAAAAGARVFRGEVRELGWGQVDLTEEAADDPVFGGLPSPLPVFQLHGDSFDLPAGAVRLAGNGSYPNQAFRLGGRVYALQFHLELTEELARDWARIYHGYIAESGQDPQALLVDLAARCAPLRAAAGRLVTEFLKL